MLLANGDQEPRPRGMLSLHESVQRGIKCEVKQAAYLCTYTGKEKEATAKAAKENIGRRGDIVFKIKSCSMAGIFLLHGSVIDDQSIRHN